MTSVSLLLALLVTLLASVSPVSAAMREKKSHCAQFSSDTDLPKTLTPKDTIIPSYFYRVFYYNTVAPAVSKEDSLVVRFLKATTVGNKFRAEVTAIDDLLSVVQRLTSVAYKEKGTLSQRADAIDDLIQACEGWLENKKGQKSPREPGVRALHSAAVWMRAKYAVVKCTVKCWFAVSSVDSRARLTTCIQGRIRRRWHLRNQTAASPLPPSSPR
jgi:hypothetical protein